MTAIKTSVQVKQRATLIAIVLVVASCASGSDGAETSSAPTTIDQDTPADTAATDPVVTTPAATTATSNSGEPPTPPPTAPPTTVPGPLPVPTIELNEVGQFEQPVNITSREFDGRVFVIEQDGRIIAFDDLSTETVLDITDLTEADAERGLLGLGFHPELDLAYVNYTNNDGDTVVAEYEIDPDTAVFDRDSFREVISISQPFPNHNGGNIAFGPDGLMYIGMGDGGAADDPNRSALDLSNPLGKILRIDPLSDGDKPYTVPEDNPFVGGVGETVWSFGLRNPWRFSFDPVTGDLWIADVGQNAVEEINLALATDGLDAGRGLNFGWSAFEGDDRFNEDQPTDDHTPPIYVYSHDDGRCSVSGGVRYRGESIRDLAGWYVFGDFCTGEIWALDPTDTSDSPRVVELGQLAGLSSIAQGPERELYAISNAGTVARFDLAN